MTEDWVQSFFLKQRPADAAPDDDGNTAMRAIKYPMLGEARGQARGPVVVMSGSDANARINNAPRHPLPCLRRAPVFIFMFHVTNFMLPCSMLERHWP